MYKKKIYKLSIVNNSAIIQGLLSVTNEQDYIYMNLLESAPFKIGKNKIYEGVAGNLVVKFHFQKEFEGFVTFNSKTNLM
jgi:hypothetical protein